MTLTELYLVACQTPSDINEHLPRLMTLASLCDKVVELGVRYGASTTALLHGLDQRWEVGPRPFRQLHSFDINDCRNQVLSDAVAEASQIEWIFTRGDSRSIVIPSCELLFIDTLHTADQLAAELQRHHGQVSKWIVMHDTETFGTTGEDGGHGLMFALTEFLQSPDCPWRLINLVTHNNGLAVIERTN